MRSCQMPTPEVLVDRELRHALDRRRAPDRLLSGLGGSPRLREARAPAARSREQDASPSDWHVLSLGPTLRTPCRQGKSRSCAPRCSGPLVPGPAAAQIDPGVNYDPGSPAGKEYAIPLVEGRSEGAGTTDQQEGANIPFGVGIEPPGGGPGKRDTPATGRNGRADRARGARQERRRRELRGAGGPDRGGRAARGHRRAHLPARARRPAARRPARPDPVAAHASQPDRKNCLTLRATGGPPAWPPLAARKCGSPAGCWVSP